MSKSTFIANFDCSGLASSHDVQLQVSLPKAHAISTLYDNRNLGTCGRYAVASKGEAKHWLWNSGEC